MKGYVAIVGILAVIFLALLTLSIFFERSLQMETAEQFNKQQLLTATAEASNIQNYLNGLREEILHISRMVSLLHIRKETDLTLLTTGLFKDSAAIKKRIEFLDRSGKVLYARGNVHSPGPDEKGVVVGARKRGCPSDVFMQEDSNILTLVAPVCRYDTFTGAVMISVHIRDLGKEFLGTLKSGSRGYAWMMDDKGSLLYHPTQANMVGRNLHKTDVSCFKCHKTFDVEKKIVEGRGDYCSGDYYGRYVAPTGEDKIMAYSSAMAGNSRWIIAVSAPYSEVTQSIRRSMNIYGWVIILMFLAASGISAWLIVTNRKREKAEERAKHEKELDMIHAEKLASLERLTSGISREIGNPLTSVFSFVDILMGMEEDEFKQETLETIFFHMTRISDILKQLSGFSKSTTPEIKPCKVNSLIENSLSLIQYDDRVQGITVMKDLWPDLPHIKTDENQLSQVLVNLVLNAADAMPGGGTLTIRSRLLNSGIAIAFEDTSPGISPENLRRIFEPFYSAEGKPADTGLGLAVSYSIVKKLNGNLSAESELNKGSRFTITLPL